MKIYRLLIVVACCAISLACDKNKDAEAAMAYKFGADRVPSIYAVLGEKREIENIRVGHNQDNTSSYQEYTYMLKPAKDEAQDDTDSVAEPSTATNALYAEAQTFDKNEQARTADLTSYIQHLLDNGWKPTSAFYEEWEYHLSSWYGDLTLRHDSVDDDYALYVQIIYYPTGYIIRTTKDIAAYRLANNITIPSINMVLNDPLPLEITAHKDNIFVYIYSAALPEYENGSSKQYQAGFLVRQYVRYLQKHGWELVSEDIAITLQRYEPMLEYPHVQLMIFTDSSNITDAFNNTELKDHSYMITISSVP